MSGLLIKEILVDNVRIGNVNINIILSEIPNGNYQCLIVNNKQNIPFNILINR
jgi:hypothetical protein